MKVARVAVLASIVAVSACDDAAPDGLARTRAGAGPTVRFDVAHRPLPEIPFPNDVATYPDPTSRTGLRINASLVAPTALEATSRQKFGELEGFGTYAPITVSFAPGDGETTALDVKSLIARHRGDDYDFADDAIYLVDLETGVPHPLDLGEGSFSFALGDPSAYWKNDTHAGEPTLMWETRDETRGGAESAYTPELDTDFDGVLDRPNLDDPYACVGLTGLDAERCKVDHLMTFYERETDTLVARPLVPMRERHAYAVVVTDRVRDAKGRPARSPFDLVYHPSQEAGARAVRDHLNDARHAAYFGDIAGTGLDHVSFVWTFTTLPTTEDLALLRDGLYGRGPFSRLAKDYPTDVSAIPLIGYYTQQDIAEGEIPDPGWPDFPQCKGRVGPNITALPVSSLKATLGDLSGIGFGLAKPDVDELVRSLDQISHIVVGTFHVPFFIPGGPQGKDPNVSFKLDFRTGDGEVGHDEVYFYLFVPKGAAQPYPVDVFGHGYGGSSIQAIAYAGNMARQGVATIALDAAWHGFEIDPGQKKLIDIICQGVCAAPLANSLFAGRARDLDADGKVDPGGDLLTGYIFHTRDSIRQSIVDRMQLVRVLRSFGQQQGADYDGDGRAEVAGDFDADGVPDVGGPDVPISTWGQSLGGILSSIHGGIDTELSAASPSAPGGGLTDVIVRSNEREVVNASVLRTLGPLVVSVPASEFGKNTRCATDELSLRFVMTSVNKERELEFGCASQDDRPMTVIVHNEANDEKRCALVPKNGRFRVGMPATRGDYLTLTFLDGAHQVTDYASCRPLDGALVKQFVDRFGKGADVSPDCQAADGCLLFEGLRWESGDYLRFPADGLGLRRGSPDLRRFLQLTQTALDPADPISFAPKYALSPTTDARTGATAAARGLMVIAQAGDQTVPISAGVALARAAGAVPFFRPDQAARFPEWASYATPQALYAVLGNRTANRVLIDQHVIEGVAHLQRHPAGKDCRANEQSVEANPECRPRCDVSSGCYSDQSCNGSKSHDAFCGITLSKATCDGALFDVDDLDEGAEPFDEQRLPVALRLARRARPNAPSELEATWAPRLMGVPHAPTDQGAWTADERVIAFTPSYIKPDGQHAFYNPAPCQAWDNATYLANLAARFLATQGRDVYPLSHPATHPCLAKGTCKF